MEMVEDNWDWDFVGWIDDSNEVHWRLYGRPKLSKEDEQESPTFGSAIPKEQAERYEKWCQEAVCQYGQRTIEDFVEAGEPEVFQSPVEFYVEGGQLIMGRKPGI